MNTQETLEMLVKHLEEKMRVQTVTPEAVTAYCLAVIARSMIQ